MIHIICAVLTVSENPKASLNTIKSSTSGEAVSSPTDIEYASQERKDTPSQSLPRIVPKIIPASRNTRNAIVFLKSFAIQSIPFLFNAPVVKSACETGLSKLSAFSVAIYNTSDFRRGFVSKIKFHKIRTDFVHTVTHHQQVAVENFT